MAATACWADVLTRAERHALAEKLQGTWNRFPDARDELGGLYGDVTEIEADTETIATFKHGGSEYEIDHLGIRRPLNWGQFAIYRSDEQVGEFAIPESALLPEFQPEELPAVDELITLAIASLEED